MSQYKKKQAQPARPVQKPVAAAPAHIASAPAQAKPTSPSDFATRIGLEEVATQ